MNSVLYAFADELAKYRPKLAQPSSAKTKARTQPPYYAEDTTQVPFQPPQGQEPSWGIPPMSPPHSPPQQYEPMDKAKWKRTLIDVPIVALGTGAGIGLGTSLGSYLERRAGTKALEGVLNKAPPPWLKHLPMALGVGSALGAYALGRSRGILGQRREHASGEAKRREVERGLEERRAQESHNHPGSTPVDLSTAQDAAT